jgi:nucleoid DNA-binding protein
MINDKVIIQKLATKYNLSLTKIEEVVYHQFKVVANVMKNGEFESINNTYL